MSKILWYSNAPWCGSGYGTQTALVVPKLIELGHDVGIASFFGLQGTPLKWGDPPMTVFPGSPEDVFAQDLMPGHYGQEMQADFMITLMDAWVLDAGKLSDMTRNNMRIVHWLPVDTEPLSRLDYRILTMTGSRVLAMSRHGEKMLAEFAPLYVPHAVDTSVFRPLAEDERNEVRARGKLEGCFIIGMNAANSDPARKGYGEQLQAFRMFHDEHPDARMLIHTRKSTRQGVQMDELCKVLKLDDGISVQFGDQYLTASGMTSTAEIAKWCGVIDLFSNCSYGEGFGLPILEAQSAGTPAVVTKCSSMTEVCGAGWHVEGQKYWNAGHSAFWVTPGVEQIYLAYEKAYKLWKGGKDWVDGRDDPVTWADLKLMAREHAMQYDINRVVKEFWVPALEELAPEALETPGRERRAGRVMKALVTGSSGFAGQHLLPVLAGKDCEVIPFDYRQGNDVRDYEKIRAAMEYEPDLIFHLAGVTQPGEALSDARRTMDVNVTGALNILEAVKNTRSAARILLVGSMEEYGYEHRAADEILTEEASCRPSSAYGVSKLAATTLGMSYVHRHGLPVVAVRPGNYTGWGRQSVNAESAFARRIVAVERGKADVVEHGDLSASRNFTDVRDMVRAFWLAVHCEPGIYNACSQWTLTMQQVMDILTDLSKAKVSLKENVSLGHKIAGPLPQFAPGKLCQATDWHPVHKPEETLAWLLDYWRSQ